MTAATTTPPEPEDTPTGDWLDDNTRTELARRIAERWLTTLRTTRTTIREWATTHGHPIPPEPGHITLDLRSLTRFSGHGWCGDHAAPWAAV